MTGNPTPNAVIDLLEGLETSPDEAAQRFVALSRWTGKKRSVMSPERIAQELGKAYREEVARILGQQVYVLLYEDDSCKDLLHRSVRVGESLPLPTTTSLRSRASRATEAAQVNGSEMQMEFASLEGIRDGNSRMNRLELILLAWRLSPLDNLAICGAVEYMFRREWTSSMRLLEPVLLKPLSRLHLSYAYETLGALWLAQADPLQASTAFRASADSGEDRPAPLCSWFVLSLALGNAREAEVSGRRIEEMLGPEAQEPDFCIRAFKALRKEGMFDVRTHLDQGRHGTVFGQHTTRITDALD